MWNLRSNSDVLDETWWEAGGNALWKRYAREDNINRDTNTLFLTDEQWAEFKAEAEKLTGWVGVDPYPIDNPLWAVKQSTILYICNDPWAWLQSVEPPIKTYCLFGWKKDLDDYRQRITDCFNGCIEDGIKNETSRWELFGIVPKLIPRLYGVQRAAAEWQGEYTEMFWRSMRLICLKAGKEFSAQFIRLFSVRLTHEFSKGRPKEDETYSPWEWLQAGQRDVDDDDDDEDEDEDYEEEEEDDDEDE